MAFSLNSAIPSWKATMHSKYQLAVLFFQVREMIEQNTLLSSKLQRALSKEEKTKCELLQVQANYEDKIGGLQAHACELKDQIAQQSGVSTIEMKDIERTVDDLR